MLDDELRDASILLVDDDTDAIKLMRKLLSGCRRLRFATSGEHALQQARAAKPDLLVMDVHMPGMSGLELSEQLRKEPTFVDLPVIVATADRLTAVELDALQRGAVDFVAKPLVPDTFLARVRSHLRSRALVERHKRLSAEVYGPHNSPRGDARLLVVDDDVSSVVLLQRSVAGLGAVHFASTGMQALAMARQLNPDLIMLDLYMEGLDGFEVLTALKSQREFEHTPVIFVTRERNPATERQALDLGAADFVSKPFEESVLRARVRNLLALKARVDHELRSANEHWRRLADERLADVLKTASDGVLSFVETQHVVLANPAAAAMLGKPAAEIVGMHIDTLLPHMGALAHSALHAPVRTIAVDAEGKPRSIELHASRASDGQLTTLVIRDISERERLEGEHRSRVAAESASQAKSRLLAYVSHEMGAPLNAVLGFAQLMQMDTSVGLPHSQATRLGHIIDGAEQLQALVSDLMVLSQQAAGKLLVELGPVDLRECLRGAIAPLRPAAQRAGVDLKEPDASSAALVLADARRLRQCLTNLLTNAIKYSPAGGRVEVQVSKSDREVRISVRDSGMGMTAPQMTQLFDPFNRLGREGGDLPGSGLGLVICRGLVEAMEGKLHAESQPGAGSTFTIALQCLKR